MGRDWRKMNKERIRFNGKTYLAKWINVEEIGEELIGEEPLENALMPDGENYVSDEARSIDESIYCYVPEGFLKSSDSVIAREIARSYT